MNLFLPSFGIDIHVLSRRVEAYFPRLDRHLE